MHCKVFKKTRVGGKRKTPTELLWKKAWNKSVQLRTRMRMMQKKTMIDSMEVKEGGLDPNQIWKLKKRLCPDIGDAQCAMIDNNGNL